MQVTVVENSREIIGNPRFLGFYCTKNCFLVQERLLNSQQKCVILFSLYLLICLFIYGCTFCCSGVMKDSTSKLRFYSAWQNMCQIFTLLKWTPCWRNKKKWSRQQYYTPWNVTCLGRTQIYSWRNYNRVEPPSSVERCSKEGRQHTLAGKNEGMFSSMFPSEVTQQSALIKSVVLLTSHCLCHGTYLLN